MFGIFKKKETSNRDLFRAKLRAVLNELHTADVQVKVVVGTAINMADGIFQQSFPSARDFINLPHREKLEYLNKLSIARVNIENKTGDKLYALGFEIYEMWLGIVSVNDKELFNEFIDDIKFFCEIGEQ